MIEATLPKRGTDDWGSGDFGAPRGTHKHEGQDYACYPDTVIRSKVSGTITKLGYAYKRQLAFRYVQVTELNLLRHRTFYVEPSVKLYDIISKGDVIGTAQNIAKQYTKPTKVMTNHIHLEILQEDGTPVDPEKYYD